MKEALTVALGLALSACSATQPQELMRQARVDTHPGPCAAVLDSGPDGSPDEVRRYAYDEAGRLARIDVLSPDSTEPDSWTIYEPDEEGRLLRERRFWRGEPDLVTTYTLDHGRRVSAEETNPETGTTRRVIRYEHDTQGHLVLERWFYSDEEDGDDGVADEVRAHSYDEAGHRVASERLDGEGHVLEFRTLNYDAAGNLIREDLGPYAGSVYATIEYSYACWP